MTTTKINPAAIARLKQRIMETTKLENVNLDAATQRLKDAMADLENVFVNRTEEIAALTLAIAARQHVLLEGKHGVAKSDLAREAFARITGASIYDKMFSKGTNHDDVFGPTLMEQYKKGIWQHNTRGALPTAHFANLEELGRASDVLLPTMMTVLNERIFHNGNRVERCPLITAVATTNFMSDEAELAAFNDRWLCYMIVKPLETTQQKAEMIRRSISPRATPKATISLHEIEAINLAVSKVAPDDETVTLFAELAAAYQKAAQLTYVSDRRLVMSFKLARARAVLEGRDKVTPDDLEVTRYGLTVVGKADDTVFNSCLQRVVGDIAIVREETKNAKVFLRHAIRMTEQFDESMEIAEARKLHSECTKIIDSFRAYNKPIKSTENNTRFNEAINRLESLRDSLQAIINETASAAT